MTLKTKSELLAEDFRDGQLQGILAESHRNFVESVMGVGAGESDAGITPNGGFSTINAEIGAGLVPLGGRQLQVAAGGDGVYKFEAIGQADIDIEANVNIAIVKNGIQSGDGAPDFILKRRMYPGAKNEASNFIYLYEYHVVVAGDIVKLEFQAAGGAVVSDVDYVYNGFRIG